MKRKILGITICMLIMVSILSVSVSATEKTDLDIEIDAVNQLIGGPILLIKIKNDGEVEAKNVNLNFTLYKPRRILPDIDITTPDGFFDPVDIPAGQSKYYNIGLSWMGRISIKVEVSALNADTNYETAIGHMFLGRYLFLLP